MSRQSSTNPKSSRVVRCDRAARQNSKQSITNTTTTTTRRDIAFYSSYTPQAIPILSSRGVSIPCLVLGSFLFFLQQIRRAALLLFRSVFSLQHIISKGYSLQRRKRCEDIKYLSLRLNSCCSLLYYLDGVERMALFVASSLFVGVASASSEARAPQRPVYYKKWRDDPKVRSYILVWCLAVSGRYCVPVCSNYLCRIQHSMYGLLLWPHTRSPPVSVGYDRKYTCFFLPSYMASTG